MSLIRNTTSGGTIRPPILRTMRKIGRSPTKGGAMSETLNHAVEDLFSARVQRVGPPRLGDPRGSAAFISFLAGFPDPASLPKADVIEATRVALERDGEWALQYGAPLGYQRLRDELLIKLRRDQGIVAG